MDEMAIAWGLDPIELRVRNEPEIDPDSGHPFSSRGLVACLREGAQRFGWQQRDPRPGMHSDGRWLTGTGVAASTYPARRRASTALVRVDREGRYSGLIDASDIGTGAWTALTQIAADALEAPLERVHIEIGDSALPLAQIAGGSMGTASWGTAIFDAARRLRARLHDEYDGVIPAEGLEATGEGGENPEAQRFAMHSYAAQFAQAPLTPHPTEPPAPRRLSHSSAAP